MGSLLDAWPNPPEPARLDALRRRLLQSARGANAHVPSADAEDVVQEAMVRFLREVPRADSPSEEIRAHVALKRERANYYRRRDRRPEELAEEPTALLAAGDGPDARFVQAVVAIEQIAGPDVRVFVELKEKGLTMDDMAQALGWTPQRVDAARKQLGRYKDELAAAIAIQLKEDPDGS